MNLIRKILAALLVSLLVGGTAIAAELTTAQKATVARLLNENATPAQIIAALAAEGVSINDIQAVQEAVALIVAAVPAAQVAAVTQAVVAAAAADIPTLHQLLSLPSLKPLQPVPPKAL